MDHQPVPESCAPSAQVLLPLHLPVGGAGVALPAMQGSIQDDHAQEAGQGRQQ